MAPGKQPPASSAVESSDHAIVSTRLVPASVEQVFKAFSEPTQLAAWWGPNGFTNTFHEFDLRAGGKWRLTMRGPDGNEYKMDKEFTEVAPPHRIVFRHLQQDHGFLMAITLVAQPGGTLVTWRMVFDEVAEAARVRDFILLANEQNFDRLETQLRQNPIKQS